MTRVLAQDGDEGKVFVCGNCSEVHVRWENWMVKLDAGSFRRLSRMLQAAAYLEGHGGGLMASARPRGREDSWRN